MPDTTPQPALEPTAALPRVGISACLLGQPVRYDGGHKRDAFLTDTFGRFVEWVPVCPEVECGLPVPREAMHLEGDPSAPRLVTSRTGIDHTERMRSWAERRLDELAGEQLCGFVFKTNSPSSGMRSVKVYDQNRVPRKVGVGLFAAAFMARFPLLPVEDEGRLHDPDIRENFIERIFCLGRWRQYLDADGSAGGLVDFHSRHKYQILAHSPAEQTALGRIVAAVRKTGLAESQRRYEQGLMKALALRASPKKNANVLQHMLGFLKERLTRDEKAEMNEIIERYRTQVIPLIVPVTLIGHYVRKYQVPWLLGQTYLCPHPAELKLRNHA